MAASDYVPTFFKKPLALGGASTDEYTPSPADPKAPQSLALHKLGVGGGYEIPNIPENKTRCGFGLERIKIRENAPSSQK